jgi:alcohol dehydrogenase
MKAITNAGPDQINWLDWPLPQPTQGQVRIHTGACGICATDIHMIAGWARTGFPSIPGHEWAGTVDAVGVGVDENWIGQHCVGENVLSAGGEVGFEYPGGYGEYFVTEAKNLYRIPDDFSMASATLMEPLAVSVRAVKKMHLNGKDNALIMGDGSIGLLVLMLLKHAGVKDIFVVGGREQHLGLAKEIGAQQTLNYHQIEGNLATAVHVAAGQTFPIVVEASGSSAAMQASLDLVQLCGQVLVLGDYGNTRANFKWNHLLHQEIDLIGSNASAGAWPEAVHLAVDGNLPLERLVTHRLPASHFTEGIDLTRSRRGEVIKVVLEWNS